MINVRLQRQTLDLMKDSFLLVYLLLTWQTLKTGSRQHPLTVASLRYPRQTWYTFFLSWPTSQPSFWDLTLILSMLEITHSCRLTGWLDGRRLPQKLEILSSDPRPHLEAERTVSIIPAWPADGRTIPEAADHLPWSTQQTHSKKTGTQTRWKVKDDPCSDPSTPSRDHSFLVQQSSLGPTWS